MSVRKTTSRTSKATPNRTKRVESNTAEPTKQDDFGYLAKRLFPTPTVRSFEIIELNASGFIAKPNLGESSEPFSGLSNILQATLKSLKDPSDKSLAYKSDKTKFEKSLMKKYGTNSLEAALDVADDPEDRPYPPSYMPLQVQTRMNLSRYFYETEGDCHNLIVIPVELLSRKLDVRCSDPKMKEGVEEFIVDHRLAEIGAEIWRSVREFGQAYPYEVWSSDGKDLIDVVPLNPLNMHVGNYWFAMTSEAYGKQEWDSELLKSVFPPAMYKSLLRHWNDNPFDPQLITGNTPGMLISGKVMKVISDGAARWERYSMPMLSRSFRTLTTRIIYQDAVRAIIEGMKNQLWVVKLGSPDRFNPNEMNALKNVLGGQAGDRTGLLVWRDSPLTVEVHVPEGLDYMLGNDYASLMTKDLFREQGINSKVMSGETPGPLGSAGGRGGSSGGNTDVDIQLYIERARYQAGAITDWITYIVKKWLVAQGGYAKKHLNTLSITHGPIAMEMVEKVSKVLLPAYDSGALDLQTLHEGMSLDTKVIIANKKAEKADKDAGLFDPPKALTQSVISPDGSTKTTTQSQPKGSPDAVTEHRNAVEDNQKKGVTPIKTGA